MIGNLAPFPWFGGKARAAATAWAALGDVDHYIEPFGGSAAVLLARPVDHRRGTETYNDTDGHLVNVWRAMRAAPDDVAAAADWPVSEIDLTARHIRLVGAREDLTRRLLADPYYYDAEMAGWWIWGACCWIGSGWCSGDGPWSLIDGEITTGADAGVRRKIPHLGSAGQGVHRKIPHLGDAGQGVHRRNRADRASALRVWFGDLAARLERVRITCGSWERVITPAVVGVDGLAGVLLDPPYPEGWDTETVYAGSTGSAVALWDEVRAAALDLAASGARVVVCGYRGTWTPPAGWTERPWDARKGYSPSEARHREVLWCSPLCLGGPRPTQIALWQEDQA